jgi:hypothetical protein
MPDRASFFSKRRLVHINTRRVRRNNLILGGTAS